MKICDWCKNDGFTKTNFYCTGCLAVNKPVNKRIFAFTDDLNHDEMVNLLDCLMVDYKISYASLKDWRKKHGKPVDKED